MKEPKNKKYKGTYMQSAMCSLILSIRCKLKLLYQWESEVIRKAYNIK